RGPKAYNEDFRHEAVRLAESGTKPLAQIARELGIHLETLRGWRRRAQAARNGNLEIAGPVPSLDDENRRRRRENARLLEEREILKKANGLLRQGCTMRFVFIRAHERIWHITTMCRVLEVSKAGYYAWRARPLCDRVKEDRILHQRIRQIQQEVKGRYGSPRVRMELKALGIPCSRKRVARLMREHGLQAKRPHRYRVTTQSKHQQPVAPNVLNRRFSVTQQERANGTWAADITYLPTREGWLYLAVILDLASRRVVGWALRPRLDQQLALGALQMALQHRRPAPGGLHHSDRGVQYASAAYQALLRSAGFTGSMSRLGDCWDNAVVESFFATLTKELLLDGIFDSRGEGSRAVFEFIEIWYNRRRRHSSLGYRSPVQYEEEVLQVS
ncbi:MAG: IS3 family transposase, partial [Gemmatimonadaceae bacterium]